MIHVSEEVAAKAENRFVFEPRGAVDMKNVGERNTWYLISELPDVGPSETSGCLD